MAKIPRKETEEEATPRTFKQRQVITTSDALLYLALAIALALCLYLATITGSAVAAIQASCHAEMVLLGCYARAPAFGPNITFPAFPATIVNGG